MALGKHMRWKIHVILSRNRTHQLATGIAFHGLSLAVPSEVVGTTALVASRSSGVSAIATAIRSVETSTGSDSTTTGSLHVRIRAVALDGENTSDTVHQSKGTTTLTARWPGWLQL